MMIMRLLGSGNHKILFDMKDLFKPCRITVSTILNDSNFILEEDAIQWKDVGVRCMRRRPIGRHSIYYTGTRNLTGV